MTLVGMMLKRLIIFILYFFSMEIISILNFPLASMFLCLVLVSLDACLFLDPAVDMSFVLKYINIDPF